MSQTLETDQALLLADLSGYTALTETHGALQASEIVLRFGALVDASLEPGVAVVDRVGDEVLCAAADTLAIVRSALRLRGMVLSEPEFPAVRAAIHRGPVLARDGKLFGAPLNLTARIANQARGGQILCTEPVARAAPQIAGLDARSLGTQRFKNVASPVALFELISARESAPATAIDPVCRMQVPAGRAAATIAFGAKTYRFCSQACARVFSDAPERFVATGQPESR